MNILVEAGSVGLLVVIIGFLLHWISLKVYGAHNLNDITVFLGHLFIIGVIVHLVCEYSGINRWYCKNGLACQ